MEPERVHDRRGPPARAVREAEILDEHRRRMREPCGVRIVPAARRHRAADHVRLRRDGLHGVVGAREQRLVRGSGRIGAVGVELRQPEAVDVRLVPDDQAGERREPLRERRGVLRERVLVLVGERRRAAAEVGDGEVDADRREAGRGDDVVDGGDLLRCRLRLSRSPDRVDAHAVEPARRIRPSLAFVSTSVGARTASSAAPTCILGPPACAAGARRSAVSTARPTLISARVAWVCEGKSA